MSIPRKRIDRLMKEEDWTHREKGKSREPYLKHWARNDPHGSVYIDMDKKFRYLADDKVVEL